MKTKVVKCPCGDCHVELEVGDLGIEMLLDGVPQMTMDLNAETAAKIIKALATYISTRPKE